MKGFEPSVALAVVVLIGVAFTGYGSFGIWPTLIFMTGYVPGFLFWLRSRSDAPFADVRTPYFVTFTLYILLLVEENLLGFHEMLSEVTGVTSPGWTISIVVLMILSIGIWIGAPLLMQERQRLGWFFAWTFFSAMGISELAHFVFPVLTPGGYEYHGGMLTAALLVPAGWWGMWVLWNKQVLPKSEALTEAGLQ